MMMGGGIVRTSEQTARTYRRKRRRVALQWRDRTIVDLFTEVRRNRVLTPDEVETLNRALMGLGPKREKWHWSDKEDRRLKAFIKSRAGVRLQPYKVNRELADLAEELGRSYDACHKRIQRLRKAMKCPKAQSGREA